MGLSHRGYNPSKVLVTLLSTFHDPSSWPRDIVRPAQWRTTATQLENDANWDADFVGKTMRLL